MCLMKTLDKVRENITEMSLGEIMRNTRDILGMKQWKLADLLGINITQLKHLECNSFKTEPDEKILRRFCEVFDYDLQLVIKQAHTRILDHKKCMNIEGKHPLYKKRLNNEESTKQYKTTKKLIEQEDTNSELNCLQMKPRVGQKCVFTFQASQ